MVFGGWLLVGHAHWCAGIVFIGCGVTTTSRQRLRSVLTQQQQLMQRLTASQHHDLLHAAVASF